MPKQFIISPVNPLSFVPIVTFDARYNALPYRYTAGNNYLQKWQSNDVTPLQVLSDWPVDFNIYDARTDKLVLNIAPALVNTNITNPNYTFTCYGVSIDFSLLPLGGIFYATWTYTDDTPTLQTWRSREFTTALTWPDTMLFEYKNFENDFAMLWNTGIVCNIRCEGGLNEYMPMFDDVIYMDQQANATKLNGVPRRQQKLYLGNSPGIPDWLADVFNWIFRCDTVFINGVQYTNIDGSKWEVKRGEPQSKNAATLAGYTIDVMPIDDELIDRLKTGDITLDSYIPYQQVEKLNNIAVDQKLSFRIWALIEEIWIKNTSAQAFDLKIGTTAGANDIGEFPIPNTDCGVELRKLFTGGPYDVYLSGLSAVMGLTISMRVLWKDLNAVPLNSASTAPTTKGLLPGVSVLYSEVHAGDFDLDFDRSTGLGRAGGNFPTCVIEDGRNNTNPMGGFFVVGWIDGDPDFGTDGAEIGDNNINITDVDQLPPHSFVFQRPRADTVGSQYQGNFAKSGSNFGLWTGDDANTNVLGSSANIPFMPKARIRIWIKCVS